MARVASPFGTVSFTRQPMSGTQTIDALMARQKAAAAARQAALSTPQTTIPGGLGQMLESYLSGKREYDASQEEALGRQQLSQAMSGVNWDTGEASPEAMQTIYGRDPETGLAVIQALAESRRAQREAATAASQRKEERGWSVEDREDKQAADLAAAEANRTSFGPVLTGEAASAVGLDPAKRYQLNQKTNQYDELGGGGVTIQNMPAEVGARIGLADVFLADYDDIYAKVASGANTGPIDYAASAVAGRGEAGETYRKIQSGVDALRRGLTGAGMAMSEASEYANRYLPTWKDDAESAASKLEGLKADLEGVRTGATTGRNAPPAPETGGGADAGAVPEIAPDDMEGYRTLPPGAKYKLPGDPTVYTKGNQ